MQAQQLMADTKFYESYSRFMADKGRYETWDEAVERVMNMHREKYKDKMTPQLEEYISFAEQAYKEKLVLGSQRALQFGGEQIFKHETKLYNCSFSHADRVRFFQETMYLLLSGCGVGFSVQTKHVAKLPDIAQPDNRTAVVFDIEDSIEGWADAFGVLISSYFVDGGSFPEYLGKVVHFDYSRIRPRGAMISGGFKAPGPDGLMKSIELCRKLLNVAVTEGTRLRPIHAYDFVMHLSDAVLSGGVRRSATICLFSKEDGEMMKAKTGDWYVTNPQRGRSNNSVALLRDELTREEWAEIMKSVKDFGEPGFIFLDDLDFGSNPCVEIGLYPLTADGRSGFQFCNLTEANGGQITSKEILMRAAKASAILGTLQSGYTNFKYLSPETQEITEREALLGASITGWMNNPDILFNESYLVEAATYIKKVNREVAAILGINPAARCTAVKPSGNASVLLGCASGIHGEHSPRFFRNVQLNVDTEIAKAIKATNPKMVEKSVWSSNGTDMVVSYPIISKEGSIYKSDLLGVKQLEFVKTAQRAWVLAGGDDELSVDKRLAHNVSNTITVDDWDEVEEYIYENRHSFAGISLLSAMGDKAYAQAPFTEVHTAEELLKKYGVASMFASGLIVDGCHAFSNNLWAGCEAILGYGIDLTVESSENVLMRDWVRRAKKFAANYFGGDLMTMTFCLKDAHNLHKWEGIVNNYKEVDFKTLLTSVKYTEVDTLTGQACSGNACEVSFI